ncbi:MAG: RidA family protein [Chloroflexi bacterium]|nr:MAG: RidA family protein [Chloroflexota bacterium]TMC28703.1 MAG: RidA family protein [Chloroflexota bacterium]TMC37621.1 MAG: RidA family protein [Chloroflexota bacterium]TMC55260.1 MAG: RidA family protein [Chloroflexota bacterium]TME41863.1 MAG: RidA family protein [Chloroflexota bacterium]
MTEPRQQYSTRTKYEFQFGYSRAVRQGNVIRVAGTAGLGENGQVVSDDVVEQARRALEIMRDAIEKLGGTMSDVIMTRVYVSDVLNIDRVAVIHGEVFRDIRPASSIVKVEFIDPRIQVEIEAEAILGGKLENE